MRGPTMTKAAPISSSHRMSEAEIEAADELAEGGEDRRAAFGERAGNRREHRERREAHHIVGDLQHHLDQRLDAAGRSACRLADRGERDAEEHREDDDRQYLVLGHRLEDRGRHDVGDEVLAS